MSHIPQQPNYTVSCPSSSPTQHWSCNRPEGHAGSHIASTRDQLVGIWDDGIALEKVCGGAGYHWATPEQVITTKWTRVAA